MALTTKEASNIIVLGIVISVLPITSTLLQDSYHVHFKHNSNQRRRGANHTMWISSKQMCPNKPSLAMVKRSSMYRTTVATTMS